MSRYLTDRQRDIVQMLVDGKNEIQVSMALGLSDRTVRTHIARAEKRMGAENRLQLCIKAISHGVVTIPGAVPLPDTGES